MNKVILIGRLTKDPEIRFTPANGVAVTTFTLAVDRPYRNRNGEREADFIPVVVWRKLAETCASNLMKGRLVAVSGRLQVRVYETQKKKRYVTEVVAEEVRFLDKPPVGEASEEGLEDIEIPELEIEGIEEDGDENPF